MSMDKFITKIFSLLRYVPYLRDEKAKVQRFLSSLLTHMKERIEFVNPKNIDEAIREAWMCYQQSKAKGETGRSWPHKKGHKGPSNLKNRRSGNYKNAARNKKIDRMGKVSKGPNGQLKNDILKLLADHTLDGPKNPHYNVEAVGRHIILKIVLIEGEMKWHPIFKRNLPWEMQCETYLESMLLRKINKHISSQP